MALAVLVALKFHQGSGEWIEVRRVSASVGNEGHVHQSPCGQNGNDKNPYSVARYDAMRNMRKVFRDLHSGPHCEAKEVRSAI
jgi:hypothetical protein